jgi:hypothetical protein
METEILFFLIIAGLIAFLVYREKQYERVIRDILAAKLSRDAGEFKAATGEKLEVGEGEPEEETVPLEDVSAEEMIKGWKEK